MARERRISNAAILREGVICARTHGVTADSLRNVATVLRHGASLPGMRFVGREVRRAIASHLQSIADEMDDADRRKAETAERLGAFAARRFVAEEATGLTVTRPADLVAGAALADSPAPRRPLTVGEADVHDPIRPVDVAAALPGLIDGVMDSDGYGIRPGYRYTVLPDPQPDGARERQPEDLVE